MEGKKKQKTIWILRFWNPLQNDCHDILNQGMEAQVNNGLTKSIGLSNFSEEQIGRIMKNCLIKPANLQVELHVQFQQKSLRDCCEKHGITICAYAPLGSPGRNDFFVKIGSQ